MNKSTIAFLISFATIAAIGTIVFAAISAGVLGWLIIGVMVLGLFALGVSHIGVGLADRFIDALNKRYDARNEYHLACLKLGYQPIGATYALLPNPQIEYDVPVDTSGMTVSIVEQYKPDALELVALSKQVMPVYSNQIAPYAKAKMNDYFKSGKGFERWQNGIRWLSMNQYAKQEKDGNKNKGTFCNSGTVSQLYEKLKAGQ